MTGALNRVRIIGGEWRSRILRFPAGASLRPTGDRIRETLFNWLGQDLSGRSALDLFAGSGALGFEAASRHAALAVLVERDAGVAQSLRDNVRLLDAERVEVNCADALHFLREDSRMFDVIFLDPPFAAADYGGLIAAAGRRLRADGNIYVESGVPIVPPAGYAVVKSARAGAVHFALLTRDG